jgi:hypothetical protein
MCSTSYSFSMYFNKQYFTEFQIVDSIFELSVSGLPVNKGFGHV